MIDCSGRFCYQGMLARDARIPLCFGRKQETGMKVFSLYDYPMTRFFGELWSAVTTVLSERRQRERLSQFHRLGNDGPAWLSDTLVSLFTLALEPCLGQKRDSLPSCLLSPVFQQQVLIGLGLCLVKRERSMTADAGCCLPGARPCVKGRTYLISYFSS